MIIISILGAIVAILIVVFIHELGHFTVARLCGVRIEKFSIGFGKALLSYTSRKTGTHYVIAMIPLGGYVKMYGEQPDQPLEDDSLKNQAYTHKNVWQRMAIASAGPLANMLLAIIVFLIVFMMGVTYVKPIIGNVIPDSIAAKAGLVRGERIVEINHQAIWNISVGGGDIASYLSRAHYRLDRRQYGEHLPVYHCYNREVGYWSFICSNCQSI